MNTIHQTEPIVTQSSPLSTINAPAGREEAASLPYITVGKGQSGDSAYAALDSLEGVPIVARDEAQRLRVVVVGHVDHGKSTLIGRIFHDTGAVPEGKEEQIRRASEAEGMAFEWAFLLDALLEEQEQNITIDTTRIPFRTHKRGYEIIDAPGHKEFLKNMITGAASADAAILVIAANEGVREQSRRHGYLLRLLGVRQIVVAVNKMDAVAYDSSVYEKVVAEYSAFLGEIGVTATQFVPVSAREGDNVAHHAADKMAWYDGPTVLETLDAFKTPASEGGAPLRFVVQDIYRFDARRLIAGRVESGRLRAGDRVTFQPGNRTVEVATIERWGLGNQTVREYAVAGESVALTLVDQVFAERGHVAYATSDTQNAVRTATRLRANLFWLGARPLSVGESVKMRLGTQEIGARMVALESVIDASTLESVARESLQQNDVAEMVIETEKPVAFDMYADHATTGRFVLMQDRRVAGGGILLGAASGDEARATVAELRSENIVWNDSRVSADERTQKNGHSGAVVWLTGLSGSGKSTLASNVHRALWESGRQTTLLDGDNLRHGLCADLGFSETDRSENIRRAAHVAALFAQSGLVTLCAFISPLRVDRQRARAIAQASGVSFVEVFVDAPLSVCESRDVKGLYAKARAGEIPLFTGIGAPYEAPDAPDVHIETSSLTTDVAARQLWEATLAVIASTTPNE